jgi:hypothetical protein
VFLLFSQGCGFIYLFGLQVLESGTHLYLDIPLLWFEWNLSIELVNRLLIVLFRFVCVFEFLLRPSGSIFLRIRLTER